MWKEALVELVGTGPIIQGMAAMAALIPGNAGAEMQALWEEYERQDTPEARFVRDMDLLEMIVQAYRYEATDAKDLSGFFTCVPRLQHPWARELGERLLVLRAERRDAPVEPLPKDLATQPLA